MLNHSHCTLTLTTASHQVVKIDDFSHVVAKSMAGCHMVECSRNGHSTAIWQTQLSSNPDTSTLKSLLLACPCPWKIENLILWSTLWCRSSKHHQNCIAKIGRPILALFLIPLVKMILLVVLTKLSDRFLIGSKLEQL
jgi:hypothetical protein